LFRAKAGGRSSGTSPQTQLPQHSVRVSFPPLPHSPQRGPDVFALDDFPAIGHLPHRFMFKLMVYILQRLFFIASPPAMVAAI
jgi:hypothetical protein